MEKPGTQARLIKTRILYCRSREKSVLVLLVTREIRIMYYSKSRALQQLCDSFVSETTWTSWYWLPFGLLKRADLHLDTSGSRGWTRSYTPFEMDRTTAPTVQLPVIGVAPPWAWYAGLLAQAFEACRTNAKGWQPEMIVAMSKLW